MLSTVSSDKNIFSKKYANQTILSKNYGQNITVNSVNLRWCSCLWNLPL